MSERRWRWLAEDGDILRALTLSDWIAIAAISVVCGATGLVLPGPLYSLAALLFGALAVTVAACDARLQLVPDVLSLALFVSGVAFTLALPGVFDGWAANAAFSIAGAIFSAFILFAIRWLWLRFRGIEAIGLGDVKLAAGVGAWLGPVDLPYALLVAAVTGLLAAAIGTRLGAGVAADRRLPFAAFLAPAAWLVFVLVRL